MHENDAPDAERFAELVGEYQLPLLRMCVLQLKDPELARDAVQETFIKAYRAWPSFRGECSRRTWLMRIAINTCRDVQRSWWHKHVSGNALPDTEIPQPFPEDALLTSMEISRLPIQLRECVLLYYYQDLSMQETADALNISVPAVSKRLKKLRKKYSEIFE